MRVNPRMWWANRASEGSTVELIDYFIWFRLSENKSKGKRCTLSVVLKPLSPRKYWLSRCCSGFVLFWSPQNREQKGDGKIVPGLRMVPHFTETWFRSLHPHRDAQPLVTPVPGAPVFFFYFCGLLREHGAHTYTLSHTYIHKYFLKKGNYKKAIILSKTPRSILWWEKKKQTKQNPRTGVPNV